MAGKVGERTYEEVVRRAAVLDIRVWSDQTSFMKTINVQEAKTHLSRLMEQAAAGETLILGKHGKPMVKLTAYQPETEARRIGGLEGEIWIDSDFDAEDPRINALFSRHEG